jgi:hypothetical protein
MSPFETEEPPSGMPEEEQGTDLPLGVPADEDEDKLDRELPGFPEKDIDTAG